MAEYLFALIVLAVSGIAFGYPIVRPFASAVGRRARSSRFTISDLKQLMILVGLAFAFVAAARRGHDSESVWGSLHCAVVVFAW